tara:strand:+ start:299 stop:511 length:213 start_codon:yes stop_codon:yes gene_type:complete
MGSNLEALLAGKTPKIRPIDPEIIIVDNVVGIPTEAGNGVIIPIIKTPDNPVAVPMSPPIIERIRASKRN